MLFSLCKDSKHSKTVDYFKGLEVIDKVNISIMNLEIISDLVALNKSLLQQAILIRLLFAERMNRLSPNFVRAMVGYKKIGKSLCIAELYKAIYKRNKGTTLQTASFQIKRHILIYGKDSCQIFHILVCFGRNVGTLP